MHDPTEESTTTHQHQISKVLANHSEEDVIYPFTAKEIAQAQEDNSVLKKLSKQTVFHAICRGYMSLM